MRRPEPMEKAVEKVKEKKPVLLEKEEGEKASPKEEQEGRR